MGLAIGAMASAGTPAAPPEPAVTAKLRKSAQEFEAMLLASWLEKMNQSFVGAGESQDAAHDTVNSLGTQAIASALAARGGIGIAALLLRQLQPAGQNGLEKASTSHDLSPAVRGTTPTINPDSSRRKATLKLSHQLPIR